MSRRVRLAVFGAGAVGFGVLVVAGVWGLPDFGGPIGAYGRIINSVASSERHVTAAVGALVFDYRAVDSLVEETILFAAVAAVALILRHQRDEIESDRGDSLPSDRGGGAGDTSDVVRLVGVAALPMVVLLGVYLIGHGHLTPGGGFQGGVVVAAGLTLLYVVGDHRAFRHLLPDRSLDPVEAAGLGGYVVVGLVGLAAGAAMLHNQLPPGSFGQLDSGGFIAVLSTTVGIEVGAGLLVVVGQFLDQLVLIAERRRIR
jgi:multicomponent Na+:H+ antiporter subunit B